MPAPAHGARLAVTGIPLGAYDHVVNGKPALDWVVERQCVKTDKDSGIANDANERAVETMKSPKYRLKRFLRAVTVSLEIMKIVRGLPKPDIAWNLLRADSELVVSCRLLPAIG